MNKLFDICYWCNQIYLDKEFNYKCRKFDVIISENSPSCEHGKPSEFFLRCHNTSRIERVEKGGCRESERFE